MSGRIKYFIVSVAVLLGGLLGVGIVAAGESVALDANVVVGGSGNIYTPDEIVIGVGETVTWNNAGGFHNVVAYDGSFSSGGASAQPWVFTHTFTAPGIYTYYCTPHESIGMTGTVTVVGSTAVSMSAFTIEGEQSSVPVGLIGAGAAGLSLLGALVIAKQSAKREA